MGRYLFYHNGTTLEERLNIKVTLTKSDWIFELLGWLAMLAIWSLTMVNYSSLPDVIPIHYSSAGQADAFGGKGHIFTLPVMATALFIVLTALNKFGVLFNYLRQVPKENALRRYTSAARMIRYLKLIIVIIFGLLTYQTINTANGRSANLGIWFLPVTSGLVLIPLLYFVLTAFKTKQ